MNIKIIKAKDKDVEKVSSILNEAAERSSKSGKMELIEKMTM